MSLYENPYKAVKVEVPTLSGHPEHYHAPEISEPLATVYFCMLANRPTKSCYKTLEEAVKKREEYKWNRRHDVEVVSSTLQNWKQISGYNEAKKQKEKEYESWLFGKEKEYEREIRPVLPKPDMPRLRLPPATDHAEKPAAQEPERSKLPASKPLRGHKSLYIVECEQFEEADDRLIKIGVSTNPRERLNHLQIGCPFELQFVYSTKASSLAPSLEKWLHQKMKEVCERGEWFKLKLPQLEKIKQFLQDDRLFADVMAKTVKELGDGKTIWDEVWNEHKLKEVLQ